MKKNNKHLTKKKYNKYLTLSLIFICIIAFIFKIVEVRSVSGELMYYNKFNEETAPNGIFNYNAALKINPDVVGAIRMDEMSKFYPIMDARGKVDNAGSVTYGTSKYCHTNIYEKKSSFGASYIKIRDSLEAENIVIYGNDEEHGYMFGFLSAIKNNDVAVTYKTLTINLLGEEKKYKMISAFTCGAGSPLIKEQFQNNIDKQRWINDILDASRHNYKYVPSVNENTIMLVGIIPGSEKRNIAVLVKEE